MSDTPELDKQHEIIESGQARNVQDFIDWMSESGYAIFRRCTAPAHDSYDHWCGVCNSMGFVGPETRYEEIMAEHFEIDLNKIEAERRLLLGQIRNTNLKEPS